MANSSSSGRWIILSLVIIGVAVALFLVWRGLDEATEGETGAAEASETEESYAYDPDGGPATRRIKENCDPITEARKYEEFVGREALAILSWNNMPERAANLEIPVHVGSVDDGAITVAVLEIPLRDPYIAAWVRSGHMRRGKGASLLIDPCSARIEVWEAMERAKSFEEKGTPR